MTTIFVGGSQRSGTTLVQTILCQDPSVNPLIQEAKYLRHLVSAYRFGKTQFKAETRDYFKGPKQFYGFNAGVVRAFMQNLRKQYPKAQHLVLREPHLTILFPELAELMPRARFVMVVRDPRDVVASMIRVGEKLKAEGVESDSMARLFNSRDIAAISRHYLSFYVPAFSAKVPGFRKRLHVVRYENLVADPEPVLEKLRAFTGVPLKDYDPKRDPDTGKVDYSKADKYRKAWATDEYAKKITEARVGSYREVLSDAEVATVTETCKAFMERFKYQ